MSLLSGTPTLADLENLQLGILRVTNPSDAAANLALIQAGTETVDFYGDSILLPQVANTSIPAVAVEASMYGVTGSSAEITKLVTQFLPAQVANAVQNGFDPLVYAAEALGLVFAFGDENGGTEFAKNYGPGNQNTPDTAAGDAAFAAAATTAIFGSSATANTASAILGFVSNWKAFYTAHGLIGQPNSTADQIDLAARGAAWGDAVGVALDNKLGPLAGEAANLLRDAALQANGELATTIYGVPLNQIPIPPPFTGGQPTVTFTAGPLPDNFNVTTPQTLFVALPVLTQVGTLVVNLNTIRAGDTAVDTVGDGALTQVIVASPPNTTLNPPLVTGVTLTGIATLTVTNSSGVNGGFSGAITGLKTVTDQNSTPGSLVTLGSIAGAPDGLATAVTTLNMSNSLAGFTAWIAASQLASPQTITINLNGNQGAAANKATPIATSPTGSGLPVVFAPDAGVAGYSNWIINATNANQSQFLELGQGNLTNLNGTAGVGPGTAATLAVIGAGNVELSSANTIGGDWALLRTLDLSGSTGAVTVTGSAANSNGGYYTAGSVGVALAGGVQQSNIAGLLTPGTATPIALTSVLGSKGTTFVDLSGMTSANINAMTKINVAAGNTSTSNTLILPNAVVAQANPLTAESGYQIIGDTGQLLTQTIKLANFTAANEIKLFTQQIGNGSVVETVATGPTAAFTLDLNGDTGNTNDQWIIVNTGANANFNLIMGNAAHLMTATNGVQTWDLGAAAVGDTINFLQVGFASGALVSAANYNTVTIQATGGPDTIANGTVLNANQLTITGNQTLSFGGMDQIVGAGGVAGTIVDNDTAPIVFGTGIAGGFLNAGTITGSPGSGGIEMFEVATTSFQSVFSGTGVTITGSPGAFNYLIGSTAADVITSGLKGDIIAPDGGANTSFTATVGDTVNLLPGHAATTLDIYSTAGALGGAGQYVATAGSIVNDNTPIYNGAWWGLAPVNTANTVQALGHLLSLAAANGPVFGVSNSQVLVNGFVGNNSTDFAPSAWTKGALGVNFAFQGNTTLAGLALVQGDATTPVVGSDAAPVTANIGLVAAGGTIPTGATLVELTGTTLANANALAQFLKANTITFANGGGQAGLTDAHMLWIYSDGTNTHIADVDFQNTSTAPNASTNMQEAIAVSDLVQLTGVLPNQLTNANIHFVA